MAENMDRCDCATSFFFPHRAIKCALKILANADAEKKRHDAAIEQSKIDREARDRQDVFDQQNRIIEQHEMRLRQERSDIMRTPSIPTAEPIPAGDLKSIHSRDRKPIKLK